MRQTYVLLLFIALPSFSQNPDIKIEANGLKVDEAYFVVGENKVHENAFPEGTKLYLKLAGVKGFGDKDGKAYPGCSMKVLDAKGTSVINYADLFNQEGGVSHDDVSFISLNLTIGSPMEINQSYQWKIKVWDKLTKSEINISTQIHVIPVKDLLGIKRNSQGLTCESTVVMRDTPLTTNICHEGEKLTFVFSGLKGFSLNKIKEVNPGASMIVKNAKGINVFEISDLFKEEKSYSPALTESIRLSLKIGDPLLEGNKYTWWVKVWDKNSTKYIEASLQLDVEPK